MEELYEKFNPKPVLPSLLLLNEYFISPVKIMGMKQMMGFIAHGLAQELFI